VPSPPAPAHLGHRTVSYVPARRRRHQHAGPGSAAGLNVASLYHYFPSKRELLVAVLDDGDSSPTWPRRGRRHSPGRRRRSGRTARRHPPLHARGGGLHPPHDGRGHAAVTRRRTPWASNSSRATQASLERWLAEAEPKLCAGPGSPSGGPDAAGHPLIGLFSNTWPGCSTTTVTQRPRSGPGPSKQPKCCEPLAA